MWNINSDTNKWSLSNDLLPLDTFNLLKQDLSKLRFYSKCLSGATFIPMNNTDDIYDILGSYTPKNWYINSPYSVTPIPTQHAAVISSTTSGDYYTKYLDEYGLTLKNLFTPDRLIKDSINNYIYVDVTTTSSLNNIGQVAVGLIIDDVFLIEGHRVLVKDQKTNIVLSYLIDPNTYFQGNYHIVNDLGLTIEYQYYDETNGIYVYKNNTLVRGTDLDAYENCVRYSIATKLGTVNAGKQYHLSRLLNGYFPTTSENNPIEFTEKHNWMLRNRVDYNNVFDTNYYDIIKNGTQSYISNGFTYSIPERTISVGSFGVVVNNQEGVSNVIANKYKVNLRSISQTSTDYWSCGDSGTILKFRKYDFSLTKPDLLDSSNKKVSTNLNSISFFNDLRGAAVGEINTILVTDDGGITWTPLDIPEFVGYTYNKIIYSTINTFYVGGNTGVFIEFTFSSGKWNAYKRRVAKYIDSDDEYILVEDINDMFETPITTWGLSYSYSTQSISSDKDLLLLATNNGNMIAYDLNHNVSEFDFLYLDFNKNYGDITSVTRRDSTNEFYFSSDNIYSFDINNFKFITSSQSNIISGTSASLISNVYINKMYDYVGDNLLICGNNGLIESATYSIYNFNKIDPNFNAKLRSKMLFLDYDIGSKLSFFDSSQNYRLPGSLTFSGASFSTGSYLSFTELVYGPTAPSFTSVTESNWLTYWRDRQKTFEYYSSSPLDDSTKVEMSVTFSYYTSSTSSTFLSLTSSSVAIGYSDIFPLAPGIDNKKLGRFTAGTVSISAPSPTYSVFLYDYLMIIKTPTTNPSQVGDMVRFDSDVVSSEFMINKKVVLGTSSYYYMFTEFNNSIINQIKSGSSVMIIKNLNKYKDVNELYDRFNLHPISNAYNFSYSTSSSIAVVSPNFNTYTSYYNLATNVSVTGDVYTMSYSEGFLDFGYKPTYNIQSYLERLNPDVFFGIKEYLAMPVYSGLPLGPLISSNIWFEINGMTYSGGSFSLPVNKIYFGTDLKLEWESVFINTFVDITIHGSSDYQTDKLLVLKKYYDSVYGAYVIEFHKRLNYTLFDSNILLGTMDITSRRMLYQISDDLQELNGIQRSKRLVKNIRPGFSYTNYENEFNFKFPTDSYAKILLSDAETIQELSALVYIDYKNELSMNITRLDREYDTPILNTFNYSGKLYISCSENHNLSTGDGVSLEFTGGTGSSQQLNPQYFGYHVVTVFNSYDFVVDVTYGSIPTVGNDIGIVKHVKKDVFLNYTPVDIIDIGIDKKGKKSVILGPENVKLTGATYGLVNVDYSNYRYRLIDGMNIETLNTNFPWILEAEIENAIIGMDSNKSLVWYNGNWECGRWFGGTWKSGTWKSGDWYDGTWESRQIKDNLLSVSVDNIGTNNSFSTWRDGRWFGGTWSGGTWYNGRWYGGDWESGIWYNGTWNDGHWKDGNFNGGIWVSGQWDSGIFNTNNSPSYWLDGKWYGGDFENGMWYTGVFDQKGGKASRFGTNSYNSRTSTWHGGKWVTGEFHSKLNLNDSGYPDVSEIHKFSIWYTGIWSSGDWYGGIAYDTDFRSGVWHGGVVEDIQVIGIDTVNNTFTLNGIFKYNIGDSLNIIDNQSNGTYSVYGSNSAPGKYEVLYTTEDSVNKWTTVYVATDLLGSSASYPLNTDLRVVSNFRGSNWKSGIWTNGIFDDGLWEGGIWYQGKFNGTWS